MTIKQSQMALDISLRDKVCFDSFVTGHNAELEQHLINVAEGKEVLAPLFIWGESGGGKSHLLNSCYRLAEENRQSPWFVSLLICQLKRAVKLSLPISGTMIFI